MLRSGRRRMLHALALGVGTLTAARAGAVELGDGHAAGADVAPASNALALIPRRSGDAAIFTASLDRAALKTTSGGWAREITTKQLPIATGLAAAHLFLNPGGAREMHWHNSAEWAFVIGGRAQATVVDPEGVAEVFNVAPGDLWYFPRGHAHAIQTLGTEPCHALLVFDDGLYSEHGTFGISDLMSRIESSTLARSLGLPETAIAGLPPGETYIAQGAVLAEDGPEARTERPFAARLSHRYRTADKAPAISTPGGTAHIVSSLEFPASATMTGVLLCLARDAMQPLHWHPDANEMHYVVRGQVRITMYARDKHLAVVDLAPGDCAYVPLGSGHMLRNIGATPAEVVAVADSPRPQTATLADWLARAPAHLLANNLGVNLQRPPPGDATQPWIVAAPLVADRG